MNFVTSKTIYKTLMEQTPTKMWTTEILAAHPLDHNEPRFNNNDLIRVQGPTVPGTSREDAQHYCDTHELGYCRVTGEVKNN